MKFKVEMEGTDKVHQLLRRATGQQARVAMANAVNDTAFHIRRAMQNEIRSVFDRPTSYITRSPFVQQATVVKPMAVILPTHRRESATGGGGKSGVDPQQVLRAQSKGGRRADKRSEIALRRAGLLPQGFQTAIPTDPYPGSDDGHGNLRGAFVSQLLSYFQTYGGDKQGFRSNMSQGRRERIADRTTFSSIATRQTYQSTRGVEFFVSFGRLRAGNAGRYSHLPPGIWARSGMHGMNLRRVIVFTRRGNYRPLLSMDGIARKSNAAEYLQRRLRYRIREAMGV